MLSNGITNIDSVTDYHDYAEYAASLGMKAMAYSEHGSVFGWLKKKETVESLGMKYIHAEEFYVTETLQEKVRDNYHCVLIARNYDGVKELNKLSSIGFNRNDNHFYYAPRITFEELINTSNNIIICTACLASILASDNTLLKERFITFLKQNKHRCFLEIQHHNVQAQKDYNKALYALHQSTGIPLITGTDTHALNEEHMRGRSILQKAKNIHFDNEDGWDLSFKTYDELVAAYKKQNALPMDVIKEAINNTNVMADMVEEFEMDRNYKYPHLWENPEQLLREKIKQGIFTKGVDKYPNYQEYLDRVEYEMEAYKHNEAIDFMLLMEDVISWCKSQDIQTGYGRGSVNGSVIAWLIGITEMDSIKFGLNFERFMNIERVSLSDIDTDFPPSRIDEVKQYIFNHHGLYCSDIVTFNTIADKGAIRDVGRALNIDLDTVGKICDSVDNEEKYTEMRKKYPKLFEYVDIVKGVVVSVGSHPCGTIVSPHSIDDEIGLFTTSTDPFPVSQLYMKEVDSLNYVKLDLLKLDTIQLISETCKMANIPMVLPDNMDIYDDNVWNSMRDNTTGCFQWESDTGQDYIRKLLSDNTINKYKKAGLNIDKMTLLSIGNSAIRPAGASYRDDLANGVVRKTGSKPIDEFLSNTFGYLVFQCQIIEFLHQYCGFTMGEADIVRRGFAKKTGTDQFIPIIKNGGYLNGNENHYIDGYIKTMKDKYNISETKSEEDIVAFIQVIEDASSYLFSLNHSQPYSFMGYACGYLRYYYPAEFITCCLNINKDNSDKTTAVTEYAKKVGIEIVPIKFGYSRADYSCDSVNKRIYKGVASVKNLNTEVSEQLYTLSQYRVYNNFIDLLIDITEKTSCNSRQLDILIKLDYFSEYGDPNALTYLTDQFNKLYVKGKGFKQNIKEEKIGILGNILENYCESHTPKTVKEVNIDGIATAIQEPTRQKEFWNIVEQCKRHKKTGEFNGYNYEKLFKLTEMPEDIKFKFATKISDGEYKNIDAYRFLTELKYNGTPLSVKDRIKAQQEYLSYIDYTDPSLDKSYVVVLNLNNNYSPKFTAYCINNGKTCPMKVRKNKKGRSFDVVNSYKDTPFNDGDILKLIKCKQEPKAKFVDGEWKRDYTDKEWWCYSYQLVDKGIN
jgi:DNA polymerase-3 subunit alpha